jgi:sn-glycerol 3-phosphate transport system permease protein
VALEKRVVFRSAWLPWLLVLPQGAIIGVFFFWPAAQTVLQ